MTSDVPLKGITSLLFGLAINCIGIDPAAGYPRFTFGSVELLQGISFIPAMIGMFALSELLRGMVSIDGKGAVITQQIGNIFTGVFGVFKRYWFNFLRGSTIGVLIGVLPGAGADIAAWIRLRCPSASRRSRKSSAPAMSKGLVEADARPTIARIAAPGFRRWCSAFPATPSRRS